MDGMLRVTLVENWAATAACNLQEVCACLLAQVYIRYYLSMLLWKKGRINLADKQGRAVESIKKGGKNLARAARNV